MVAAINIGCLFLAQVLSLETSIWMRGSDPNVITLVSLAEKGVQVMHCHSRSLRHATV